MQTLAEWRTQIVTAHPSLTKQVNGVSETLGTAEYNATIDSWAQASFNQQEDDAIVAGGGESAKYAQFRVSAYPPIGDQLDMLYKDRLNSTTTWTDAITAIKTKFAKPS
jgi:hypothetical protein